jgi:hypothetical protein
VSCIVCSNVLLRHTPTIGTPWTGFHVRGIGSFSVIELWRDYERKVYFILRLLLKELEVVGDPFFEWGFVRF